MGKGRSAAMQRLKAVENGISGLRKACRMPNRRRATGLAVCINAELHTELRFWVLRCAKMRNCTPRFRHSLRLSSRMTHYDIVNVPPSHPARPTKSSSTTHNDIADDTPIIQHITPRYLGRSTKSSSTTHNDIMNCGAVGETVLLWLQLSQRIHP